MSRWLLWDHVDLLEPWSRRETSIWVHKQESVGGELNVITLSVDIIVHFPLFSLVESLWRSVHWDQPVIWFLELLIPHSWQGFITDKEKVAQPLETLDVIAYNVDSQVFTNSTIKKLMVFLPKSTWLGLFLMRMVWLEHLQTYKPGIKLWVKVAYICFIMDPEDLI